MAISSDPIVICRVQTTAVSQVQADPAPYDNTNTIEVYNRGVVSIRFTAKLYVAGARIADYAGITVPAGASYRWPIGTLFNRPCPAFVIDDYNMLLDSDVANPDIEVHYFNSSGSST